MLRPKIRAIYLEDYSDYDPETCHTGGNYSFTERLVPTAYDGVWTREYLTSADFDYCRCCGNFISDGGRDEDGACPYCHDREERLDVETVLGNVLAYADYIQRPGGAEKYKISVVYDDAEMI